MKPVRMFSGVLMRVLLATAHPAHALTKCTMEFSLSGWSAFYKTASGSGTISCDDGQSARVKIRTKGGGLTVGKSKVTNGHGKFSEVAGISELYGG